MFGISFSELLVIFIIAFLVLGPEKLQDFAKSLGKFISSLNNFSANFKSEINNSLTPTISNKDKETNDFNKNNFDKNVAITENNDKK